MEYLKDFLMGLAAIAGLVIAGIFFCYLFNFKDVFTAILAMIFIIGGSILCGLIGSLIRISIK